MFGSLIKNLLQRILREGELDIPALLAPWSHSTLITTQRAVLIIARVRLIAALFAFFTPLWITVDVLLLPHPLWLHLALSRLVATVAFVVLSLLYRQSDRMRDAYVAVTLLFAIPTAFYFQSHRLLMENELALSGLAYSLVAAYAFLPFVMVAGLAVFPFTALEGVVLVLPALLVKALVGIFSMDIVLHDAHIGLLWLLGLVGAVAVLSGMSQLHYLAEIITKSAHDPLTRAFNRPAGRELLEKYFYLARRNQSALTLLCIDLDQFKAVNDRYGHETGDRLLKQAVASLSGILRKVDLLIRWEGVALLVVLPNMAGRDHGQRARLVERLSRNGLGALPDGAPLRASVGLAELVADQAATPARLVELADARMYRAKKMGRNRLCFGDGEGDLTPEGLFGPRRGENSSP